ncbi:hypothetical protein NQ317_013792 [Molorchus minor]|uniref:Uncharacterized protein n=1 Tax=Molorchus minor TaxID=1323400 RepID=A0ABQ9JBS3_9CUCU|nr:hypothetical protein NQ317_013792 [Molorchus minor]
MFARKKKKEEKAREELIQQERKEEFENVFNEKSLDIFKLPGLTFLKFTYLKIKFSFEPSRLRRYISKKVIFYCSLKYYKRYKIWNIRRDSFPVNYKRIMYQLFYTGDYFRVTDDLLLNTVFKMYDLLIHWAKFEDRFRTEKFARYQQGDKDIFLDSDDEELFFNTEKRKELHRKRNKILKRMLPPAE